MGWYWFIKKKHVTNGDVFLRRQVRQKGIASKSNNVAHGNVRLPCVCRSIKKIEFFKFARVDLET